MIDETIIYLSNEAKYFIFNQLLQKVTKVTLASNSPLEALPTATMEIETGPQPS